MVDVFGHNLHLKISHKFSILPKKMPNAFSQPIDIDQEWAQSLVSLHMKVLDHWWHGYSGSELYDGTIAAVNFDDHGDRCFQLDIDQEKGALYPMQYDAVLHYADERTVNSPPSTYQPILHQIQPTKTSVCVVVLVVSSTTTMTKVTTNAPMHPMTKHRLVHHLMKKTTATAKRRTVRSTG